MLVWCAHVVGIASDYGLLLPSVKGSAVSEVYRP